MDPEVQAGKFISSWNPARVAQAFAALGVTLAATITAIEKYAAISDLGLVEEEVVELPEKMERPKPARKRTAVRIDNDPQG